MKYFSADVTQRRVKPIEDSQDKISLTPDEARATCFVSTAPISYSLHTNTRTEYIYKIKGLTLNCENSVTINYNSMVDTDQDGITKDMTAEQLTSSC